MNSSPPLIGQSISRITGRAKVTGKADYTSDYSFPDMAWTFVVKSSIGCGKILAIDSAEADKSPGVIKTYVSGNFPKVHPPKAERSPGMIVNETFFPLAGTDVEYFGQDVAYVVAETYEQARQAASLVRVSYTPQVPVTTEAAAKLKTPPKVHGEKTHQEKQAAGVKDPAAAWDASVVKHDAVYETPFMHHNPMEPHAVVAKWDADHLTFYTPSQWVYGTRNFLASSLGVSNDDVQVVSHYLGGGFGCKGSSWMYMLVTAAIARELDRPVKYVMERENMFTSNGYRPMTEQHLQLGADKDGRLTVIRHFSKTSNSTVGDFIEGTGHASTGTLYACDNREIDHQVYALNLNSPTFMRAPGESPGVHALESAMDELAVKLELDPVALRLKNLTLKNPFTDLPFSSCNLEECYHVAGEKFGWSKRNPQPGSTTDGDWLVGWGMATATYPAQRAQAKAKVRILADGSAEVQCATQDLGTGTYTILAQMVAQELALPIEKVKVRIGESKFPEAPVSGGSQSAASVMPAAQDASRAALEAILKLATEQDDSPLKGLKIDDVVAIDGGLRPKAASGGVDTYVAILQRAGQGAVEALESATPAAEKKTKESRWFFQPETTAYQSFGAYFTEVRVHKLTCEARVSRVVVAMDIGQPLNLKTARSQVYGGAAFAIGAALTEHSILDPGDGHWITHDLGTYHVPVNADVPEIDVTFVGPPDYKFNSLGARGVGEIGNTGLSAAIGNAIYHATGARVRSLPITPDKILMAMLA
jgi:xanthine dehydrogenase YagR molybdenum-binding subunit